MWNVEVINKYRNYLDYSIIRIETFLSIKRRGKPKGEFVLPTPTFSRVYHNETMLFQWRW